MDMTLMRIEYTKLSTGTVRAGATGHGESLTDVENYLMPLDRVRGSTLFRSETAKCSRPATVQLKA